MKKLVYIAAIAVAFMFSSCAMFAPMGGQLSGVLYTGVQAPVTATSNEVGTKVGTSSCINVLGLVSMGEGSIQEAAKQAGITKISHVDKKTTGVLGLFSKDEIFVYGE